MSSTPYPKPLDLSYLYEISDHDRDFIKEMLLTIVKTTPSALEEIKKNLSNKDWEQMGRQVHKLKPSLLLLNIDTLTKLIRSLEDNSKSATNIDHIPQQVSQLDEFTNEVLTDLNELLSSDNF